MIFQTRVKAVASLLGAAAILSVCDVHAAPPLPRPEKSLLGVHLLSTFKDVMKKYGQPNEIQVGSPALPSQVPQNAAGSSNTGMPGMFGGMPGGMAGGMPGMPGGMMGGRRGMMGGPSGMMGAGGSLPGFAGGKEDEMGGRRGMFQGGGGMAGRTAGIPGGFPGGSLPPGIGGGGSYPGGFPGGAAGMGYPGMNGGEEPEIGAESTWWYHFPKRGLHISFLFNKDGKVIQIQEYGWKDDGKTSGSRTGQGIGLGSSLGSVIQKYGWSNDGDRNGNNLVMRYGGRDRLALQLVKNAVVGITLAVVN